MKNFKKLFAIFTFTVLFVSFLYSCSDEQEDTKYNNQASGIPTKNSTKFKAGDIIGKVDANKKLIITVNKSDLLTELNDYWISQGENYNLTEISIIQAEVKDEPLSELYLLYATNSTKTIKAAIEISFVKPKSTEPVPNTSFKLINSIMGSYHISCLSDCQFGCNPTTLRNPAGQLELTCMRCTDGQKCSKRTSL